MSKTKRKREPIDPFEALPHAEKTKRALALIHTMLMGTFGNQESAEDIRFVLDHAIFLTVESMINFAPWPEPRTSIESKLIFEYKGEDYYTTVLVQRGGKTPQGH